VQQRLSLQDDRLDVYSVLVKERVRRVIELSEALIADLSSQQVTTEKAATEYLYNAAKRLCDFLDQRRD
jgi:hypothetical protein